METTRPSLRTHPYPIREPQRTLPFDLCRLKPHKGSTDRTRSGPGSFARAVAAHFPPRRVIVATSGLPSVIVAETEEPLSMRVTCLCGAVIPMSPGSMRTRCPSCQGEIRTTLHVRTPQSLRVCA